jgi:plasmid stabilization system protein ParE
MTEDQAAGKPAPPSVIFDPAARDELAEAVAWYDQQREGLGDAFLIEVKRAARRIIEHPQAWSKLSRRTRRCRLARFPYGVIYQPLTNEIRILAVAHLHRKPGYWQDREQR